MMSGDAPIKEKRKKSKRAVVDTEPQEDSPKKDRKSKKTHRDTTNGVSEVIEDTVQTVIVDGVAAAEATKTHKEKKKKNRQKDDKHALEEDPRNSTEEDSKPSKKKRKRSPVDAVVDQLQADKRTKKHKKHKQTAFTNPSEDETLSDQARKSLTYVFTHFQHPDAWKFNKAKQNWLIRNLWSDQAIPELYLPLSIKYLSGVKGGIRDALSKTCNDLLGEVGEPPSSDTPGATPAEAKYVRAKILFDALQNESH